MNDIVKKPNHYQLLPEYEVKDVIKALLNKIDESDFEMSSFQAGWLQQSLQYQMRFYAKNGLEDLEKAHETLGFVIDDLRKPKQKSEGFTTGDELLLDGNGNPMKIMADGQECYLVLTPHERSKPHTHTP